MQFIHKSKILSLGKESVCTELFELKNKSMVLNDAILPMESLWLNFGLGDPNKNKLDNFKLPLI